MILGLENALMTWVATNVLYILGEAFQCPVSEYCFVVLNSVWYCSLNICSDDVLKSVRSIISEPYAFVILTGVQYVMLMQSPMLRSHNQ